MAVGSTLLDADFLTTVPLANPAPRSLGQPAGLWLLGNTVTGDASGGISTITCELTPAKKTDFVYEWMHASFFADSGNVTESILFSINTGPRIPDPTGSGFTNVTYRERVLPGGVSSVGISVWPLVLGSEGRAPVFGYGDNLIPGNYQMCQVAINGNVNTVLFTLHAWGFYYRYQTFFRGLAGG